MAETHYQNGITPSELGTVTYSRPCGFGVMEKWRAVGLLFGVDAAVARSLCKRFGVNPDEQVAQ